MSQIDWFDPNIQKVLTNPQKKKSFNTSSIIIIVFGLIFAILTAIFLQQPSLKATKISFRSDEQPTFVVQMPNKKIASVKKTISRVFSVYAQEKEDKEIRGQGDKDIGSQGNKVEIENGTVAIEIKDNAGNEAAVESKVEQISDNKVQITLNEQQNNTIKPGKYTLETQIEQNGKTYNLTQDFTWGVLAINTDQSIYSPDQEAFIGMAVLDDNGNMVCDAKVRLKITHSTSSGQENQKINDELSTENGQIKISEQCTIKGVTNLPDYYTNYQVKDAGEYEMELTAETANGTRQIQDRFYVEDNPDFMIKREGPTRVYPPATYKMKITVKANLDFPGPVKEYLPASLEITPQQGLAIEVKEQTQILTWQKDFIANEEQVLEYEFKVPPTSPAFYLLGPLEIGPTIDQNGQPTQSDHIFRETRQWQIAADAPDGTGMLVYDEDGAVDTTPHYRTWSGTDFNGEGQLQNDEDANDDTNHTIVEAGTTRDEYIVGRLIHLGELDIQIYSGGSWSDGSGAPANGDFTTGIGTTNDIYRGFDIAYEASTGDGLVLYEDGTADGLLKYRYWNGTQWSAEANLDYSGVDEGADVALWVECEADYDTDNILCGWQESAGDGIYGARWDGSAWQDVAYLTYAGQNGPYKNFDLAWEGSGQGMIFYGLEAATPTYFADASTYTVGVGWADTTLDSGPGSATNSHISLAGSPNHDIIAMAYVEDISAASSDYGVNMWNGSDWTTIGIPTENVDTNTFGFAQGTDVAWEIGGDRALFVYRNSSLSTTGMMNFVYDISANQFQVIDNGTDCLLTEGGAGTTEQVTALANAEDSGGPCLGNLWADLPNGWKLVPDPSSSKIMVLAEDTSADLVPEAMLWNGDANGTWLSQTGNMAGFEIDLSPGASTSATSPTRAYDFAFNRYKPPNITVSGGCFTNAGEGTPCTDGGASDQIKVAVNGVLDAGSDGTVDGGWSFTISQPASGAILTFFRDGAPSAAEKATTVVKYDGDGGNVTLVKMYQSMLVIGADATSDNSDQTIINSDLDTTGNGYEYSDDAVGNDPIYGIDTGVLTVDQGANLTETLYIISGDTFQPDSGGGDTVTTHHLYFEGTYTTDNNATNVAGDWTNAGTFTATTGSVVFNGTSASQTIISNAVNFYAVTFNNSSGSSPNIYYTGAMTIGNNTTLSSTTRIESTNNTAITFSGTINGGNILAINSGSGTVTFNEIIGGSTPINSLTSSGSGTVAINTTAITVADVASNNVSFTGPVTLGGGLTITTNKTTNDGTITFSSTINNAQTLSLQAGSAAITVSGTIGGTTGLSSLDFDGSTITLADIGDGDTVGVSGNTDINGTTDVIFAGTTYKANSQTYASVAGNHLKVNGGVTTFTSSDDSITFDTADILLADGSNLTVSSVGGAISVQDIQGTSSEDVTLNASGGSTNTVSVVIIGGTPADGINTVILTGSGGLTLGGNITTSNADGNDVTVTGPALLNANITIDTNTGTDGWVNFTSTVDSTGGARTFAIDTGDEDVTIGGATGNSSALSSLTIGANDITIANIGGGSAGVTGATSLTSTDAGDTGFITFTGTAYNTNAATYTGGATDGTRINDNVTFTTSNDTIDFNGVVNSQATETNAVILAAGSGQVTFNNNVGASQSLGLLTKEGAGDVKFITNTLTCTGLTLTLGTINTLGTDSGVWTVSGNVLISAGTLKATTNTFSVGGDWTNSDTFTAGSGTVDFTEGSGTQTLNSGGTGAGKLFNNLTHSGAGTLQLLTNAIDVDGNFNQTGGIFDAQTNNLSQNFAGDFSLSLGTTFSAGGTLTFDKAGSQTFTDSTAGIQDLGTVAIGTATATTVVTDDDMKVTNLTLTDAGDALNISNDTLTITGTGTPFTESGTFTTASSTVVYTGTTVATNITTTAYNNLTLTPTGATTYSLTGDLIGGNVMTGNLTINTNATLDTTAADDWDITLPGNWSNSGGFTANESTVTLNGAGASSQEISGETTFYNLAAQAAADRTLKFESDKTQSITNNLNIAGSDGDPDELITLTTIAGVVKWKINSTAGTVNLSYLDVNYSNATGNALCASYSIETNDNNLNWTIAGGSCNANPDDPDNLLQKKTDNTVIATDGWTNETSVKYTETVSDPDGDQVRLCVEKDEIDTDFSDTEDLCGDLVDSGQPASVTIPGHTPDEQYHWQARTKDDNNAYSNWVSYGGNSDGTPPAPPGDPADRDYGIDTSDPTDGNVNDGAGADQDYNDGDLNTIQANWAGFNATVSGLNKYQYAIRRGDDFYWSVCAGAGAWQAGENWCDNGAVTTFTQDDLNLQTSVLYYVSVRAVDNAGNTQVPVINSDGQYVLPTLSFVITDTLLEFPNLNNINDYQDNSQSLIVRTSTNGYNGYSVKAYRLVTFASVPYPTESIVDFQASYANPEAWPSAGCVDGTNCGFGYTSNDPNVNSGKFTTSPCAGGGGDAPCYAPFQDSPSGDTVADNTGPISGTPITDEEFTITHGVAVPTTQAASLYQTYVIFICTANY